MFRKLNDDEVKDLLSLAKVDETDATAASRLQFHYREAWTNSEGERRPAQNDHNDPLEHIQKLANDLREAILKLNSRKATTHAKLAFWTREVWSSPLFATLYEFSERPADLSMGEIRYDARIGVELTLERISRAASEAQQYDHNGRPVEKKRRIVQCAFDFFVRASPYKPTSPTTGKFGSFAKAFYEKVTGLYSDEKGQGLGGQLTNVIKENRAAIDRYWASRVLGSHELTHFEL